MWAFEQAAVYPLRVIPEGVLRHCGLNSLRKKILPQSLITFGKQNLSTALLQFCHIPVMIGVCVSKHHISNAVLFKPLTQSTPYLEQSGIDQKIAALTFYYIAGHIALCIIDYFPEFSIIVCHGWI